MEDVLEAPDCGPIAEDIAEIADKKTKKAIKGHRKKPPVYFSIPDDGPPQLRDMRHVMNNDSYWDKTLGQKRRRILLDKHPLQFEKFLAELEKAFAESKSGAADPGQRDGGTERALALVDTCLASIRSNK